MKYNRISNRRKLARDLRNVPTKNTLMYIQQLIGYKRTHIEREQERLRQLEAMEYELLLLVKHN